MLTHRNVSRSILLAFICLAVSLLAPLANAAITWDAEAGTNWWFDPQNWSQDAFGYLPPTQDSGGFAIQTDAQINIGPGAWDTTGEGVVYDPDNDPFFAAAAGNTYATGSPATAFVGRDYGPEHIHRIYISRNTTNSNLLTIKSGDLVIASTTIIGRSGSTAGNLNEGRVDQLGGQVRLPVVSLDIGNSETSGWGNGVYSYQGGTLQVSLEAGPGIRLAHGRNGTGPSGVNRFIIGNPNDGGHIRTWDYNTVSYRGSGDGVFTEGLDPNGIDRGVAITEFEFENGGFRPVQVARNVTLNNGIEPDTGATLSSRLILSLNEAPAVDGSGVPEDQGLFDVDFDIGFGSNSGVVNGFGDINNDTLTDAVFASEDGSEYYLEGSTVSGVFGNTRYDWTISYTGDIAWSDADNSVLSAIGGAGSGGDIVLIGLGSEALPGLAGDYNNNGVVDAADYTVWRDNLGAAAGTLPNDVDGGTIGAAQYDTWKASFGNSGSGAGAAVPEPATLLVFLISLAGCVGLRRRS